MVQKKGVKNINNMGVYVNMHEDMKTILNNVMGKKDNFEKSSVLIGVVTTTHGLNGGVKVKPFTDQPDAILNYDQVYLDTIDEPLTVIKLQNGPKNHIIVYFSNITTRELAEGIKGSKIFINYDQLPELDSNEYYWESLIGCKVYTDNNIDTCYGKVITIHNFGAGDIMEVECLDNNHQIMIPFTQDSVLEVTDDKIILNQEIVQQYEAISRK